MDKNKCTTGNPSKIIVDCDPGGDDAAALLLLLGNPDKVQILAITITHGNIDLDQASKNALRILKLHNRLEIPIFMGSQKSISQESNKFDYFFGSDGFGEFVDDTVFDYSPYLNHQESAPQALVRLVDKYPKEITLFAIGPLTNLANALKLDPHFGGKLKETIVMGGNYRGVGNITPHAEFNFHADPEAANIVMTKWVGPVTLVTWELCIDSSLSWEWFDSEITGQPNIYSSFLKKVMRKVRERTTEAKFIPCDQLAAALLIDRDVVKRSQIIDCRVEIEDSRNRGENVIDWKSMKENKNVCLIEEINLDLLMKILSKSMRK